MGITIKRCLWTLALTGPLAWPAIGVAAGAAGDAETASSGALEEVVVTATRRSERLQDVPISVTAFSQEKMDAQGLRSIDDLTRSVAGSHLFSATASGSSANYNDESSDINIRGIDSAGGHLDHRHLYRRYADPKPSHRLRRRQRLSGTCSTSIGSKYCAGPQGTLFGAGAEGGVVRFITPSARPQQGLGLFPRGARRRPDGGDPSYELGAAFGGADHRRCARLSRQRFVPPRRRLGRSSGLFAGHRYAGGSALSRPPTAHQGRLNANSNWQQTTCASRSS